MNRREFLAASVAGAALLQQGITPAVRAQGALQAAIDASKRGEPISPLISGGYMEPATTQVWAEMLTDRKFANPITADEAWEQIRRTGDEVDMASVHLALLPKASGQEVAEEQREEWKLLMELRRCDSPQTLQHTLVGVAVVVVDDERIALGSRPCGDGRLEVVRLD